MLQMKHMDGEKKQGGWESLLFYFDYSYEKLKGNTKIRNEPTYFYIIDTYVIICSH